MSKPVPAEDIYFFERERWPRAYADLRAGAEAGVAEPVSS